MNVQTDSHSEPAEATLQAQEKPGATPAQTPPPEDAATELGEAGMKALDAERRARRAAERELTSMRKQSEALAADVAEAKAKLADLEHSAQVSAWKRQVSADTGVPEDALRGESLEDLKSHAEVLAPLLSRPMVVPTAGRQPDTATADSGRLAVRQLFGS
ncbi:hypothetical protein [Schaalia hyovaginalis]|uniref:DUF4355 domain-containing protein n=1 Tax=Schaalia hyovaginalis TaxID=29316 RepID=A0A923E324_9ACTO|nr:hypothetical protein [Schaalia hyovaginalis]MBB6333645.1 hypothetical protein [Schaalia hyovaginalis]MDY2669777.1 hypothetical protein [Schaalia hyovaginalis]